MAASQDTPNGSKKKACVQCRQQKMRCTDGSEETATPCSRCQRLNLSCVYSAPFRRVHKRKRMEELEQETSALRRELQIVPPVALPPTQTVLKTEPTEPRSIDGFDVDPVIIDSCFRLFFRDYHPLLPILDPTNTPNALYGKSPVLFWVVVSIGSRKHSVLPNLVSALSSRVSSMVSSSLYSRTKPLESIKAALLLLEWPFPATSYNCEPAFIMSGAIIHTAMQNGLHTSFDSVGAFKADVEAGLPDCVAMEMAQLWAYVIILYQRSCAKCGQPALWSVDIYTEQEQFKHILQHLSTDLQLQLRLSNTMARAQRTFVQFASPELSKQQERTLDSVIQMLTSQLDTIEHNTSSAWERFYIATCRLEVTSMYFFKSLEVLDGPTCQSIFNTTLGIFEFVRDQERTHKISSCCPKFITFPVTLGLAVMLRILKGPFAGYVDQERGSTLLHDMINFFKSVSIEHDDKPNKVVRITEQMWKSHNLFKSVDGGVDFALRIRNRLSMSVVTDIGLRWKEESFPPEKQASFHQPTASFPPLPNVYQADSTSLRTGTDDIDSLSATEAAMLPSNELLGDIDFDLDDLWSRTFDWT